MEQFVVDPTISYDIVELPSRGICYSPIKKSVRVAYMTAADENILAAPNLIQSNSIVNELLKRKVIDKDINVDDIIEEDRQAILIFLRNTAFGSDYNLKLQDPETNEDFPEVADLSTLDFKPFTLVPDENGEFPYFMEKSKTQVTFKFLTRKQENELKEIEKSWKVEDGIPPIITKRLEMHIKSVKGNRDMMNIHNFVQQLPIVDSQSFRKHITDNKPGIDLKRKAIAPSGKEVQYTIGFGVEFFRPFYGL